MGVPFYSEEGEALSMCKNCTHASHEGDFQLTDSSLTRPNHTSATTQESYTGTDISNKELNHPIAQRTTLEMEEAYRNLAQDVHYTRGISLGGFNGGDNGDSIMNGSLLETNWNGREQEHNDRDAVRLIDFSAAQHASSSYYYCNEADKRIDRITPSESSFSSLISKEYQHHAGNTSSSETTAPIEGSTTAVIDNSQNSASWTSPPRMRREVTGTTWLACNVESVLNMPVTVTIPEPEHLNKNF